MYYVKGQSANADLTFSSASLDLGRITAMV